MRRACLALVGLVACALLATTAAGCAGVPTRPRATAPTTGTTAGATSSATATSAAIPATSAPAATPVPAASLAHLSVALVRRWSGFTAPVYIANAGDGSGRLFVVEQPGVIRVIRGGKLLAAPYLDIRSRVIYGGERGLLGLAFSPSFKTNGRFYVDYVDLSGNTIIAEAVVRDPASDVPSLSAFSPILRIRQPYPNHKGGCLQFGPDGYLYIGMGDGGSEGDPGNRGQNPGILLGKLLRIDPEHATGSAKYAIPPGQPMHPGWAPENFAIGLRNPWRFSFDASGGALWIGDVGQDRWEEIDVAKAGVGGQNYGWNVWEGDHPYPPGSSASRTGFTFPIAEYSHPYGECITGGYVYRGTKYPALVGTYLYADYIKGWLAGLRTTSPDGRPLAAPQTRRLLTNVGNPSSFGVDEAGELYLVDYRGTVWGITAKAR